MPAGRCRNYRTKLQGEQDENKKETAFSIRFLNNAAEKKRSAFSSGALLCREDDALINFNKFRIARADDALCIYKAVHVNRNPAAVHEHEVRVANQPEMSLPEPLDKELFRMPSKTKHFSVTRPELLFVHGRRLTCATHVRLTRVHVRLARASTRARTHSRLCLVYLRGATFNACLSAYVCARLRFCLRIGLLLSGAHLLPFRWRSSLRFFRLLLRLLWFRLA